jgi:hypothetical protein
VFPVRYELGSYIPEDTILHSHRLENFKFYIFIFVYPCQFLYFFRIVLLVVIYVFA